MSSEAEPIKSPSRAVWRAQMRKGIHTPHRVSRITCWVNHLVAPMVIEHLAAMGIHTVFAENGRIVREVRRSRPLGLPDSIGLNNAAADIYRFTVPREGCRSVVESLIGSVGLHIPGRGTIFSQDLVELSVADPPMAQPPDSLPLLPPDEWQTPLLQNLAQVTCVLSVPGSADRLARVALELGICVPIVTHGVGTDIRDQLGLIRITIPANKEVVHLLMPAHDFDSIFRLLIEEVGLNRPGRGFLYRTPVSRGMLDTRLRIGKQAHAASMEQIIAAIDQLKGATGWRKRISCVEQDGERRRLTIPQDHCELTVFCLEDRIGPLIRAAVQAGASGATTTLVRRIAPTGDTMETSAWALSTISVPAHMADAVVDALLGVPQEEGQGADLIQVLDSPVAYAPAW